MVACAALLVACAAQSASLRTTPPPGGLVVAAIGYEIRGDRSPAELLASVRTHVEAACARGASWCVFPELVAFDCWPLAATDEARAAEWLAAEVTGPFVTGAAEFARELGVTIVVGAPRLVAGRVRNTTFVLFADGREVLQDKLYLTDWERRMGWQPGDRLELVELPQGRAVVTTCYDVEIPAVTAALAAHEVDLVLVPSMTESAAGLHRVRACAAARAVEHHAFVVVAGTVGAPQPGWVHHGRSVVLAPHDGARFAGVLAEGPLGAAGPLVVALDFVALAASRRESALSPARDERARTAPWRVQKRGLR